MTSRTCRCLWVEDRPEEVSEVVSKLIDLGGWEISLVPGREEMLNEMEATSLGWDIVILDGRLVAEYSSNPEDAGRNIFLDLRSAEFGEWGRDVPVVLYSGIAEVLDKISRVKWPEPTPKVISKNDELDGVLRKLTEVLASVSHGTESHSTKCVFFFGAGRIGLGIGVPLIADAESSCLILFNRLSSKNSQLLGTAAKLAVDEGRLLTVSIGSYEYPLDVWFDGLDDDTLKLKIAQVRRDRGALLVMSDSDAVLRAALDQADLCMCSVGEALEVVIDRIERNIGERASVDVIALENDHTSVNRVARNLVNNNSRLSLYPAVVDRICSEVIQTLGGIKVVAGPAYEFCTIQTQATYSLFKAHKYAQLVGTPKALECRNRQKAYLVNLLHWVIAIVRASRVSSRVNSFEELDAQFLDITGDSSADKHVYETLARLLAIKVLHECDSGQLKELYPNLGRELIVNRFYEKGLKTIRRASRTPDRISRIIRGSSSSKYRAKYAKNLDSLMIDIRERKEIYYGQLLEFFSISARTLERRLNRIEGAAQEVRRMIEFLEIQSKR